MLNSKQEENNDRPLCSFTRKRYFPSLSNSSHEKKKSPFFTHEIMPREGMRSTKGFRDFISFNSLLLFHSVVSFSKKAPPPPSDMKYEVSCINADPISQKLFFTNNCEVPVLLFGVFIETLHNGGEEVYKSVFLHMKYLFSLTYDLFL